jgi:molybdopterin-guanine dinucleotide biosynthesis protein A
VLSPTWRNSGAAAGLAVASDTHGVSDPASYAVVVLAGGTARRMGGGDKTALDLGAGRSVLDHLVSGFEETVPVVVVGPSRTLERSVVWARESPPGGGPLAGLSAGLDRLSPGGRTDGAARTGDATWVVLVAGDQPFAAEAVPVLLTARGPEVDAVIGVDPAGRDQPLLGVYRAAALRARLGGDVAGRSMHSLLDALTVVRVPLPGRSLLDIDDPDSLAAARAALAAGPNGVD